jgi:hypothetical protein
MGSPSWEIRQCLIVHPRHPAGADPLAVRMGEWAADPLAVPVGEWEADPVGTHTRELDADPVATPRDEVEEAAQTLGLIKKDHWCQLLPEAGVQIGGSLLTFIPPTFIPVSRKPACKPAPLWRKRTSRKARERLRRDIDGEMEADLGDMDTDERHRTAGNDGGEWEVSRVEEDLLELHLAESEAPASDRERDWTVKAKDSRRHKATQHCPGCAAPGPPSH